MVWYRVRDEVLLKSELHIFGIVGQKDQKWVKLDKISVTVHAKKACHLRLEYDEIVPTCLFVFEKAYLHVSLKLQYCNYLPWVFESKSSKKAKCTPNLVIWRLFA